MMETYTILAEHYDALTTDVPYQKWADYIERHFARRRTGVHTVAELGCGTGTLAAILAGRGYSVTALDLSPDMLTAAAEKCAGLDVTLVCQDMSRLSLPSPADAVLCCLDSLNYITRPAAVRRTFQRVFSALRPGGLYCVWRGEYSEKRRICGYGIDLFAQQSDGSWARGGEYHEEYAYTMDELSAWLSDAGFSHIRQFGALCMRAPKADEQRIFFTAERKE